MDGWAKQAWIVTAAALATATLASGCGGGTEARPTGVKVSASLGAWSTAEIARVILVVTPEGSSGSSPTVEASLSQAESGAWVVYVDGLPAPGRYTFTLQVLGADDRLLYSGSATANVVAGRTTELSIVAQQVDPDDPETSTPIVYGVEVPEDPVAPGTPVTLTVLAVGSAGDVLAISWQDSCGGSFLDASAASTTWTAPATAPSAPCQLSVRVSEEAASVTVYFAIHVE